MEKYKSIIFILLFPFLALAQGSFLLVGGGSDGQGGWSDGPFGWFVAETDSGIIIDIDTDTGPGYASQFKSLGADPASETMIISTRSQANDSSIYKKLIFAKGIFMHGGDQWPYIETWKGTLVEEALHYVFEKGGALGGTSAGLAVLGEIVFDAQNGSAYPDDTAYNPYDSDIHFTDDFLDVLPGVLTDSHFHSRIRIGRLVPMMARRIQDYGDENIMGIGIADASALTVDPDKIAKAWGRGSVTILYKSEDSYIDCRRNVPLTFTNINFDQLIPGAVYNLTTRELVDPGPYLNEPGEFPAPGVFADTTLNGSDVNVVNLGEVVINGLTSSELNAWNGRLSQSAGTAAVLHSVIIPQIYDGYTYDENRIMGGMWGCATNPHFTAIYLDDGCIASINSDGVLAAQKLVHILDTYNTTYIGINGTRTTNYSGIVGAKLHFLGPGMEYDLANHEIVSSIQNDSNEKPRNFRLYNNYPNPFNHKTRFSFNLKKAALVRFELFNIEGKLINVLLEKELQTGNYEIDWNFEQYSTGIYYYRLSADGLVETKKCIYMK